MFGREAWKTGFRRAGKALRGKDWGDQSGGLIDNVPAMLTAGEYVVGRNAVSKYGTSFLNSVNRMQFGGSVGGGSFVQGEGDSANTAPTTNNNNVGITVNFGSDATPEVKTVQDNAAEDPKAFASKVREAVMGVIREEGRVGGSMRGVQSNRRRR
jgi:hypothetical protein